MDFNHECGERREGVPRVRKYCRDVEVPVLSPSRGRRKGLGVSRGETDLPPGEERSADREGSGVL